MGWAAFCFLFQSHLVTLLVSVTGGLTNAFPAKNT
jgi:hypothetical protein